MVDVFIQDKIKKLIPDDFDKATIIKIDGKYFVFDDESFEKYKLFSEADHLFRIIEIDGYLVRERKCDGKLTSFHRWLMDDEIEKIYEEDNGLLKDDLEVHHLTMCKRINMKKHLKVVDKKKHKILHSGYYGIDWLEKRED